MEQNENQHRPDEAAPAALEGPVLSEAEGAVPSEAEGPVLSEAEGPSPALLYPSGAPIPPTHPDHGPMHLLPRQEDGSFAAYYYCSKEELAEADVDRPPARRQRKDGITPERIEVFLRTLRASGSVCDAARAAGCSRQAFYDLYDRPDAKAFRDGWDQALLTPSMLLASTAFDRAVNGVEHKVFYKGELVGTQTKYDNRLLIWLLRVRDPLHFAPLDDLDGWLRHRGIEPRTPLGPALDRIAEAEEAWGRRLPGESGTAGAPDYALPPALAPSSERQPGPVEWPLRTGREPEAPAH